MQLKRLMSRLIGSCSTVSGSVQAGRHRQRRDVRPRLEALEDRVAPATSTWVGGSLNGAGMYTGGDPNAWSNPFNWQGAVPQPGDTALFTDTVVETYNNNGNMTQHNGPQSLTANVDTAFSVAIVNMDA